MAKCKIFDELNFSDYAINSDLRSMHALAILESSLISKMTKAWIGRLNVLRFLPPSPAI